MRKDQHRYPSLEIMIAYIEGRLPDKESKHLEDQIHADEGLQQDIEELRLGLSGKGGRSRIDQHTKDITAKINALDQAPTSTNKRLLYLSIAASIIIIASFFTWRQLQSQPDFQPQSLMAWNDVPTLRSQSEALSPALTQAFQFGVEQQWDSAAVAFESLKGLYFQNEPIALYEGRALFMAGEVDKAILIFSKESENTNAYESTRDKARLLRLAAYVSISRCISARVDLEYFEQKNSPAFQQELSAIKKSVSKKCK